MVLLAIISLLAGTFYSLAGIDIDIITIVIENKDITLYVLMVLVGIGISAHKGIIEKIKEYKLKIVILPLCTMIASLIGGIITALILGYTVFEGMAVAGGVGWYSLTGVMITNLATAQLGSIAFLSNLMREMFSFILIPFIIKHFNSYTSISFAGATSEDTMLPMLMKHTDSQTVVLSIIHGMLCSIIVPIIVPMLL